MTDKNREIEEFENDLIKTFDEEYNKRRLITPDFTAEALYNAGYRKASDVVRKIFEEIENYFMYDGKYIGHISQSKFTELKKKYTESEKGNG